MAVGKGDKPKQGGEPDIVQAGLTRGGSSKEGRKTFFFVHKRKEKIRFRGGLWASAVVCGRSITVASTADGLGKKPKNSKSADISGEERNLFSLRGRGKVRIIFW